MIYLNWHKSANFGDRLSKYIVQKLSGDTVCDYHGATIEHYMVTGSIANHANANTIIWGAGVAFTKDIIPLAKDIPMIRGKLSKRLARLSGNKVGAIGDPVLLMPQLYKPNPHKKYKLGIIPHVVEYIGIATRYMDIPEYKVIDLCQHPEDVIKDILSCEACISSSLHGIIASHAYGIPCEWVKFSDKIGGDGFKYFDYFSSVGIPSHPPVDMTNKHIYFKVTDYEIKHKLSIDNHPFI